MTAPASGNTNFDRLSVLSRLNTAKTSIREINAMLETETLPEQTKQALAQAILNNEARIAECRRVLTEELP